MPLPLSLRGFRRNARGDARRGGSSSIINGFRFRLLFAAASSLAVSPPRGFAGRYRDFARRR